MHDGSAKKRPPGFYIFTPGDALQINLTYKSLLGLMDARDEIQITRKWTCTCMKRLQKNVLLVFEISRQEMRCR